MAENVKVADAYVDVGLRDQTRADAARLQAQLRRSLPGKQFIPVEAKVVDASPSVRKLQDQLYELRRSARIVPTYEAHQVVDAMGQYHTRYFKVSRDAGTFIGEVMSTHTMKSMATMMRMPGLFAPVMAGVAAGVASAAQIAAPINIIPKLGLSLVGAENWDKFKKLGREMAQSPEVRDAAAGMVKSFYENLKVSAQASNADDAYIAMFNRAEVAIRRFGSSTTALFSANMAQIMDRGSASAIQAINNAFPGIVMAMDRGYAAVDGAGEGLERAALGFTSFVAELTTSSFAAGQTFRSLGTIVRDAGADVGIVGAAFTNLFGARLWNEAELVIGNVFDVMSKFVTGALGPFGTGMEIAGQITGHVLGIIEPFAGILGTWVGTVLGVTVAIRGFSSAMGILAATTALLKFAPITAAITTLTTQVGTAGAGMAAWTTRMTGSVAAGDMVANTTSKVVSGFQKVGQAIPIAGAALVAASVAFEVLGSKSEEVTNKVLNGSMTLQEAINAERNVIELNEIAWAGGLDSKEADVLARQRVVAEIQKQMASMDPLSRAVANATLKEGEYRDALRDTGPHSDRTKAAAGALAQARRDEEQATFASKQATKDLTQALIENQQQIMGMANADLAYRQAMHERSKAQQEVNRLTREGKTNTDEFKEASFRLEGADIRVAEAHGRLAQENRGLATETDKATAEANAQRESILRAASAADGSASPAMVRLAGKMKDEEISANNAAVKTSGLAHEVRTLPDGRQVLISTPGLAQATQGVKDLGVQIQKIPGRNVEIFVSSTGKGGIASAGRLATGGILPGYTPGRDVHVASSPFGPIELSGGEAVMRPEWTRAIGPGWINAANAAARAGGIQGVRRFMGMSQGEGRSGDSAAPLAFAAGGITPVNAKFQYRHSGPSVGQIWNAVAQNYINQMGGKGLAWARTQAGKPYIWGGVGPRGYDCSGFMSAITNVIRGKSPHSRVGATGNFPWSGFKSGYGPFTIGSTANAGGGIGHMAGTIGGTNVESRGGQGVVVGASARGASNGLFRTRAHLAFDDGGLATGVGLLPKRALEPERVLSPEQTRAFERWMDRGSAGGGIHVENLHLHVSGSLDDSDPARFRQTMVKIKDGIRSVERSRS